MVHIGNKIKILRELKNFTQEYMAEELQISQSTYSRFEREDSDINISQLHKIAEVFEMKVEDLLNFNERIVFNNYGQNQGYIINVSPAELYEKHISALEKEIEHLKGVLDKVLSK